MADIDKLADSQDDLLMLLRLAINENLEDLDQARERGRISSVAWLARNLLELSVWARYCVISEANARQFVLDSARDVHDVLDVPDGMFSEEFSFRQFRNERLQELRDEGFETLDDRFTAVASVAKNLGVGEPFKYANKLLSKFAHPTALAIVGRDADLPKLLQRFYELGRRFGKGSLDVIAKTVRAPSIASYIKV